MGMGDDVELTLRDTQCVMEVDGNQPAGRKGGRDAPDQTIEVIHMSEGVAYEDEVSRVWAVLVAGRTRRDRSRRAMPPEDRSNLQHRRRAGACLQQSLDQPNPRIARRGRCGVAVCRVGSIWTGTE